MKSNTHMLSVGFVGFLEEETPDSGIADKSDPPPNVGFSEKPPKPDKKTRQTPDKSAAAEVSDTSADRVARLDAERNARDKVAGRG